VATVAQIEQREATGNVTLDSLKKMAEALESELVYAFVPRAKIQSVLREKAFEKAKEILSNADTHMALEDQRVEQNLDERVERLATKLMEENDVW